MKYRALILDPLGVIFDGSYKKKALHDLAEEVCRKYFIFGKTQMLERFLESRIKVQLESPHVRWPPLFELTALTIQDFLAREKLRLEATQLREFLDYYKDRLVERAVIDKQVVDLLQTLRTRSVLIALVANMEREILDRILKKIGVPRLFHTVVASSEVGIGMPNTLPVEFALYHMRTGPHEVVMLGSSSYHNLNVARSLSLPFLFYGPSEQASGARSVEDPETLGQTLTQLFGG